jgi:protein-S-isoprenylcysteine O-methyltransferase Ste14
MVYGVVCYSIFFVTFLYMIGFLNNAVVPKGIDSGMRGAFALAMIVNVALFALFGLQHSIMARPGFKQRWTRIVPKPIERSTYTLLSSVILILLFWQWRPMPTYIWHVEAGAVRVALTGFCLVGFLIVLYTTFLIDHFDLFGLRQVFLHMRDTEYTHKPFMTPSLYRMIRHPLYLGWMIAFWSTPDMSVGHLLFAAMGTAYMLIAIPMEEKDLAEFHGEDYKRWRESTPMIVPFTKGG